MHGRTMQKSNQQQERRTRKEEQEEQEEQEREETNNAAAPRNSRKAFANTARPSPDRENGVLPAPFNESSSTAAGGVACKLLTNVPGLVAVGIF